MLSRILELRGNAEESTRALDRAKALRDGLGGNMFGGR